MFKPRGFPSMLSLGHRPFRAYSLLARNAGDVNIQRVRMRKPILSSRRVKTFLLYTVSIYLWWNYALPMIVGDEEEDVEDISTRQGSNSRKALEIDEGKASRERVRRRHGVGDSGGGDDDEDEGDIDEDYEDDEDAIFIPLGWARQLPRSYYKGTDPEWQEFIKFARDRKRGERVRHELAGMIFSIVSNQPHLVRQLGKDIQVQKFWLDIDFPDGPAPEYERSGLIITEDYIAWGKRPVSQRNYSRLHQALYPYPMFASIYATYKAILALQVQRARQLLGLSQKPNDDSDESFRQRFQDLQRARQKLQGLQPQKDGNHQTNAETAAKPNFPAPNPSAPDSTRKDTSWPGITGSAGQSKDLASVFSVFARTLGRSWKPVSGPPPRGSFVVSGLVEVTGSRAMCVIDVGAAYDPKLSKFVGIGMKVRRFQLRIQSPKGGG